MTFSQAINLLASEEQFRATVYAMNTLLIQKGIYSPEEFEYFFCQHAENFCRGFKGRLKVRRDMPSLASPASP